MNTMTDDKYVDRYVRITKRERFVIVCALSLLKDACYTKRIAYDEYGNAMPSMKEVIALSRIFCEDNWKKEYPIRHPNKVVSVQTIEKREEKDGVDC